jgi:hypothetical protein
VARVNNISFQCQAIVITCAALAAGSRRAEEDASKSKSSETAAAAAAVALSRARAGADAGRALRPLLDEGFAEAFAEDGRWCWPSARLALRERSGELCGCRFAEVEW